LLILVVLWGVGLALPLAIAFFRYLPPVQLNDDFWLLVCAALAGVELSALNHLLLDGLLIPLPRRVKTILKR
jgi:hypothetical protein